MFVFNRIEAKTLVANRLLCCTWQHCRRSGAAVSTAVQQDQLSAGRLFLVCAAVAADHDLRVDFASLLIFPVSDETTINGLLTVYLVFDGFTSFFLGMAYWLRLRVVVNSGMKSGALPETWLYCFLPNLPAIVPCIYWVVDVLGIVALARRTGRRRLFADTRHAQEDTARAAPLFSCPEHEEKLRLHERTDAHLLMGLLLDSLASLEEGAVLIETLFDQISTAFSQKFSSKRTNN